MSTRFESAIQSLYEDPGVRDELPDDQATLMLKWAETEVTKLDSQSADDAAFQTAFDSLRGLLSAVNRFVGRRAYSTPEEQASGWAKIVEHAASLGYALPSEIQTAFAQAQSTIDDSAALTSLLALIDGSAAEMGATSAAPMPPGAAPASPQPDQSSPETDLASAALNSLLTLIKGGSAGTASAVSSPSDAESGSESNTSTSSPTTSGDGGRKITED